MILAFPQNGKYPWIGVFKGVYNTGIGNRLGGCAGTLVAANWLQNQVKSCKTIVQDCHCSTLCAKPDKEHDVHRPRRVCYRQPHWHFGVSTYLLSAKPWHTKYFHMPFNRKEVKLAEDPIVHGSYNVPKRSSNDIALLKVCSSWTRCYLFNFITPAQACWRCWPHCLHPCLPSSTWRWLHWPDGKCLWWVKKLVLS